MKRNIGRLLPIPIAFLLLIGVLLTVEAAAETSSTVKTTIGAAGSLTGLTKSSVHKPRALYLLLLGSDSRGELNARSDSMILCYIDFVTTETALVSIPRDTKAKVQGHGVTKINSALAYGGPELAVQTVRELTGLPVQYYVETTFKGFKRLVNGIGGVRFTLTKPVFDEWAGARLPAGTRVLNGDEALALCRSRHVGNGDFDRMTRQQQFILALLAQEKDRDPSHIPAYFDLIKNNCRTNLSPEIAEILIEFLKGLEPDKVTSQILPGKETSGKGGYYIIMDQEKSKAIFRKLKPVAKVRLDALLGE
jgi:LCP family protein required for cell wall assembly